MPVSFPPSAAPQVHAAPQELWPDRLIPGEKGECPSIPGWQCWVLSQLAIHSPGPVSALGGVHAPPVSLASSIFFLASASFLRGKSHAGPTRDGEEPRASVPGGKAVETGITQPFAQYTGIGASLESFATFQLRPCGQV